MCVGVTLKCDYGGVVSVCRLQPAYGYHNHQEQQDIQCTYIVTKMRVRATIVVVENL